jgi:hypothetical protein
MARKPAAAAVEELPPAMDYAQHTATYAGFMAFIKWSIVSLAFIVLALYAFIEAHSPIIGTLLVILSVVVPAFGAFMERRKPTA